MKQTLTNAGFTLYERIVIEWQFRHSGGFQTALMYLIAKADTRNRNRLSIAYPDEVRAFAKFSEESGWWQGVERRYVDKFRRDEVSDEC